MLLDLAIDTLERGKRSSLLVLGTTSHYIYQCGRDAEFLYYKIYWPHSSRAAELMLADHISITQRKSHNTVGIYSICTEASMRRIGS
jgi:hypothetical protein